VARVEICGYDDAVNETEKGPGKVLSLGRFIKINGLLLVLALVSIAASVLIGQGGTDFSSLWPLDPENNEVAATILLARLPRTLLAALVGAALAAVGVAFQALLRNPLADPFIMGVSGGAALGGTLALAVFGGGVASSIALQSPAAFLGALAATLLVYKVGKVAGRVDTVTILLVGVVFNAFASAVIMFVKTVVTATKTQEILVWLMGSLGYREYSTILIIAIGVFIGIGVLFFMASRMNALALGEQSAAHLGVDVEKTKMIIFFSASLLVGLAVSVSGLVGFVGLIVPHVTRLMFGPDHRLLLPASILSGCIFLVLADLAARLLFVPLTTEPPVGVVTAFLGGPFFLLLLRKRHKAAFVD
jgi:ABC-type Fe3+-siderophore transport system permease subunit